MCDSGAACTIIDRAWAESVGIYAATSHNTTITGYDSHPKQELLAISPQLEFDNFHGLTCQCNIILGNWSLWVRSSHFAHMLPHIGIAVTGLNAISETPLPEAFSTTRGKAVQPVESTLSLEDTAERATFLAAIQPYLDANANIAKTAKANIPGAEITIDLYDNAEPSHIKQYSIPHAHHAIVDDQIAKWFAEGSICLVQGSSDWNSPLIAPPRYQNGVITKYQVCCNLRRINSQTKPYYRDFPTVRDSLEKAADSHLFSAIDLEGAYQQFSIRPEDQLLTTFTWKGKMMCFTSPPFGLRNMPNQFQEAMDNIFQGTSTIVYMDDICIHSKIWAEHTLDTIETIKTLTKANLRIKPSKCSFGCTEIKLLGFVKSLNSLSIDPSKLDSIKQWKTPFSAGGTDYTPVEHMLGFLNYLRDHIPLYSTIAAPLEKLCNVKSACLKTLTQAASSAPMLHLPNFSIPFRIATDASNYGVGAILYHINPTTQSKHYVKFAAKTFTDHQSRYSATHRELLAIIFALDKFHAFIHGTRFTLKTDHKALTYLFSQTELTVVIQGWIDKLLAYDFSITHIAGIHNCLPDHLSRILCDFETADPMARLPSQPTPGHTGATIADLGDFDDSLAPILDDLSLSQKSMQLMDRTD
ncbi:hypothetical protein CcCBS67573_g05205 [Chytriomyces confervae]|uniref:Reverse transcriptase domain-containing protein n=1 Tax=Chytriomyces confervae TaxID=246404 RepID=A0A507FB23_9FUNG|nr:hypothetical protein CcCBS67573_g05205 [Chytriomyces confervae]